MRVDEALGLARQRLPDDDVEREGELLLQHVLSKPRYWLFAYPEAVLSDDQQREFENLLERCKQGEPPAYLLGTREFWSLPFRVTPATLVPRQDTETLVEVALALPVPEKARVLDLGTGSGVIACALAHERPDWEVEAVDCSSDALAIALENINTLSLANVRCYSSQWFSACPVQGYDLLVSNPPYLADDDPHLESRRLQFEPLSALVAKRNGLADLYTLIDEAPEHLLANGWLVLEHGYEQGSAVRQALSERGFLAVKTVQDLGKRDRVSLGQWSGQRETNDAG